MLFDRFFDAIDHWARETPDAPATWFGGRYLSYAGLAAEVDRLAAGLAGAGVSKGDVVGVLTTPRPEFLVSLAAIHKAGGIYLGISPSYTPREQLHVVADSRPVVLLSLATALGQDRADEVAALAGAVDSVRATFRLDPGPAIGCLAAYDSLVALGKGRSTAGLPVVAAGDASTLVYTSGSSGAPKGAVLPHVAITYGAHCDAEEAGIAAPRVLCNLPTNHIGSIVDVQGSAVVTGGMVAYSERFDPEEMLRLVEELRLTNLQHVPTVLQMLLAHPDFGTRDLSSLRLVAWGGAPLPIDAVRAYRALGVRLLTVYGMTETCGNIAFSRADDSDEILATTVGTANPDADVRVVGEDGEDVADGEEGEVWYRHPATFLSYLNNPDATAGARTPEGFLRTGDIAVRLPSGHLRLVGRTSEMFKSGGLNVYPREVELVLESHPGVALAAVVGMPDPVYGEVGAAFVARTADALVDPEGLRTWCKERLAGYKVPKSIEIRDELPLLPVGKVDKQALRRSAEHGSKTR